MVFFLMCCLLYSSFPTSRFLNVVPSMLTHKGEPYKLVSELVWIGFPTCLCVENVSQDCQEWNAFNIKSLQYGSEFGVSFVVD